MSSDIIIEGQRVRVEINYRLKGVPTNPTIAQVFIKNPSGSVAQLTYPDANFVRIALGKYEVYYTLDQGGTWWFKASGAGVIDGVDEVPIIVQESVI
jgi:hypothetical protein